VPEIDPVAPGWWPSSRKFVVVPKGEGRIDLAVAAVMAHSRATTSLAGRSGVQLFTIGGSRIEHRCGPG
jgi:hypothetical protein